MLAAMHPTPATGLALAPAFAAGRGVVSLGRVEDNQVSAIVLNAAAPQPLPEKLVNMVGGCERVPAGTGDAGGAAGRCRKLGAAPGRRWRCRPPPPMVPNRRRRIATPRPATRANAQVSRRHARLEVVAGQLELVDLQAVNGTFVNDARVEKGSRR